QKRPGIPGLFAESPRRSALPAGRRTLMGHFRQARASRRPVPVHPWSKVRDARESSGSLQILGRALAATVIPDNVEGQLLSLGKTAQTGALDGGHMDENIRLAIAQLDEAVTFGCIKEFHGSSIHGDLLSNRHGGAAGDMPAAICSNLREDRQDAVARNKFRQQV